LEEEAKRKRGYCNNSVLFRQRHTNVTELVKKALTDEPLRLALQYYRTEIVEADRPLYGVYKAIEEITKHFNKQGIKNARKKLGELAGFDEKFVEDIMSTVNVGIEGRHSSGYSGLRRLSDEECRHRARLLIEAYARSL
jgi:hypothetical protein